MSAGEGRDPEGCGVDRPETRVRRRYCGDEEASTGIAVSPEQIPQYFRPRPDMACIVPARR